ncbi:hypothetical protein ONZ45_g13151 [Pleurotus djamor]|nr:hypothetical protein ONZ45_g13151 [Pleurotus djamor]
MARRGRPRLYHTPEERTMANRAKSKRSYQKQKALINVRKTLRYRYDRDNKQMIPGATKTGIPTSLDPSDVPGWLALARTTNEKYKAVKNGRIKDYVESLCQRYLNNPKPSCDIFEEALLEIGSFDKVLARCHKAVLQLAGVGAQLDVIRRIQQSVRETEAALEDVVAYALGGYVEFTETYQLRKFVYQSYLN